MYSIALGDQAYISFSIAFGHYSRTAFFFFGRKRY